MVLAHQAKATTPPPDVHGDSDEPGDPWQRRAFRSLWTLPSTAEAFVPAHSDLPDFVGVAAQVASEDYVEALARVVFCEAVVTQTPTDSPEGHYWTIQVTDVLTNVWHQLGSASRTPGGKFLLVGPTWGGEKPAGFLDVLRVPTNVAGVFPQGVTAELLAANPEASRPDWVNPTASGTTSAPCSTSTHSSA